MGEIPSSKYYVTPQEVRDFLGISFDSDMFSDERLNARIERAMQRVDWLTNTVWNGRRRKVREWHSLTRYRGGWLYGVGYPIYVGHYPIQQVTSLKVFRGGTYVEFVGTVPEDRGQMGWWVQDIDGIIFIRKWVFKYTDEEIQIEYVYGRDDLPYYVKELTLLYVARELIAFSRYAEDMPEGMGIGLKDQLVDIERRIDELESKYKSIRKVVNQVDLGEVV